MNELKFLIKAKKKQIKFTLTAVLLLALLCFIFYKGYSSASDKYQEVVNALQNKVDELSDQTAVLAVATKEVTIDMVESSIKDIGELATIEYLYTDAGKFENTKQLWGKDIPFTTKSFIAKWDGCIKAGIDIQAITIDVDNTGKCITIHMPKAQILSQEIDKDSIETLDEKNGLFNPVQVEDVREFDAVSQDEMCERAIANGILEKATENAKNIIETLVNTDVVQEQGYTLQFDITET